MFEDLAAGVLLQQLVKHVRLERPFADACTAQVLNTVAGLLKHTWEDLKVLDILKLLFNSMGALLKHTVRSVPGIIGEAPSQLLTHNRVLPLSDSCMKKGPKRLYS